MDKRGINGEVLSFKFNIYIYYCVSWDRGITSKVRGLNQLQISGLTSGKVRFIREIIHYPLSKYIFINCVDRICQVIPQKDMASPRNNKGRMQFAVRFGGNNIIYYLSNSPEVLL